ncbi:MAG: zinc ribbon domain-containing protein [Candidatus Kariarchaeaceae archaeon]|jgi:hypothetical protein
MSNVEKYCEECGTANAISAKFCQVCGEKFYETSKPFEEQPLIQPPQYHPRDEYIPPSQHPSQQQGFQPLMMSTPTQWQGGGLIQGIKLLYTSPSESASPLLEDLKSPSSVLLVFILASLAGLISYLDAMKIDYLEIDVDPQFESQYEADTIRLTAIIAGVFTFAIIFAIWWIWSWILGLIIKGGLPFNSVVRYNASQSMRKLNGYRYVPSIIAQLIRIILLLAEDNRTANVSMGSTGLGDAPIPKIVTDYSDFYVTSVLLLSTAASIIAALILYRVIKRGLHHTGIAPALVSMIVIIVPFFLPIIL